MQNRSTNSATKYDQIVAIEEQKRYQKRSEIAATGCELSAQSMEVAMEENVEEKMGVLKHTKVQQLVQRKGRLVEVPYSATVGDTLNALLAKSILAVPVAAPPGHWVGAGGSMIMEADKSTGHVRKQFIGMVSVLDILIHVVEEEGDDFADRLSSTVASIIGHSREGLSLWTISPTAS